MSAPVRATAGVTLADRIAEHAGRLEAVADPAVRGPALELLQAVMELHAAALARIVAAAQAAAEAPRPLMAVLLDDPVVRSVLLLHDLHPHSLEQRIRSAMAELETPLRASGSHLEWLGIEEGAVRLRLSAGAGAPADALKNRVERQMLDAAPDAQAVEIELFVPSQLIPIEMLLRPAAGVSAESKEARHATTDNVQSGDARPQ